MTSILPRDQVSGLTGATHCGNAGWQARGGSGCLNLLVALFDWLLGRPEPGPDLPAEEKCYLSQDGDVTRFDRGDGSHLTDLAPTNPLGR